MISAYRVTWKDDAEKKGAVFAEIVTCNSQSQAIRLVKLARPDVRAVKAEHLMDVKT